MPRNVTLTKVAEAKAALERGEFDAAFRLSAEAQAELPEDPEARELYAVIHLAKAIRLSDHAREARRLDLLHREIDYDVEFQDSPEVARVHALAEADPTNKQIPFTIRKIERPCVRCGDTGFCPHCKGRGQRRVFRMERKCEQCYGRGICPACGVL